MRQRHLAGEKLFIDYSGPTVDVIDRNSGEVRCAQISRLLPLLTNQPILAVCSRLSPRRLGVPSEVQPTDEIETMTSSEITSLNIKNHTGYCDVEMNIKDTANATTLSIITRVPSRDAKVMEGLQRFVVERAQLSLRLLFDEC